LLNLKELAISHDEKSCSKSQIVLQYVPTNLLGGSHKIQQKSALLGQDEDDEDGGTGRDEYSSTSEPRTQK
jgi:hypothetical protein